MFNLNSDGFSSAYALPQLSPWSNFNTLQSPAALQAWQQAAQQMALQQLLAQQLATQNMHQQPVAGVQVRAPFLTLNPSIGPQSIAGLTLVVQQIAQSLHGLAQQLTQLAAQSSIPGFFSNAYANSAIAVPAYGNQYFPNPLGPQAASGLALH